MYAHENDDNYEQPLNTVMFIYIYICQIKISFLPYAFEKTLALRGQQCSRMTVPTLLAH